MINLRKTITLIIQLSILSLIGFYLSEKVNFQSIKSIILTSNKFYLLATFVSINFVIVICAFRWKIILKKMNLRIGGWSSIGAISISSLINTSLPVLIGGDFIRIWIGSLYHLTKKQTFLSIFFDRMFNILGQAIIVLILLFLTICSNIIQKPSQPILIIGGTISLSLIFGFIFLIALKPLSQIFNNKIKSKFKIFLDLSDITMQVLKNTDYQFKMIVSILLCHVMSFFAVYFIIKSFGYSPSIINLFLPISIALISTAVPITPGGWGVRESIMVIVLNEFQIPMPIALAISIIYGISLTVASIPFSAAWFFNYIFKDMSRSYVKN